MQVAVSACEHILPDLATYVEDDSLCINYISTGRNEIHNANTLGASFLARTYSHARKEAYRTFTQKAMQNTAKHQRANGFGYYGGGANVRRIDNFHIARVSD